ncbi:uncharacterized protein EV422DRAFT_430266 [Fimicolochytrium jonesii]|uniref:uncharacterized protein n=1 Tax=Fimicolochytrium jonesii TaxID=1396493 RepID=UPI0022FEBEFA|nr:uncharacterized protein EV422DRAFT_430266 [Fimicolochytrium jonesii]KAI8821744.1 hypothetical protein EV422DRAFT_430266 [Fimicolochytrium jonesii]
MEGGLTTALRSFCDMLSVCLCLGAVARRGGLSGRGDGRKGSAASRKQHSHHTPTPLVVLLYLQAQPGQSGSPTYNGRLGELRGDSDGESSYDLPARRAASPARQAAPVTQPTPQTKDVNRKPRLGARFLPYDEIIEKPTATIRGLPSASKKISNGSSCLRPS